MHAARREMDAAPLRARAVFSVKEDRQDAFMSCMSCNKMENTTSKSSEKTSGQAIAAASSSRNSRE